MPLGKNRPLALVSDDVNVEGVQMSFRGWAWLLIIAVLALFWWAVINWLIPSQSELT